MPKATQAQQEAFIKKIAPIFKKWAKHYGYKSCAGAIAQACHECGYGVGDGSEIKVAHNNILGIKYNPKAPNRLDCHIGYFDDKSTEEYEKGKVVPITALWYGFANLDMCIKGYYEFLEYSPSRYRVLKQIEDPGQYLIAIQNAGYATGKNYAANTYPIVLKHNLQQYDEPLRRNKVIKSNKKLSINVHAGHNPDGKPACGAIGLLKESTENRIVKDLVINKLRQLGHTVYDCTCDNGTSVSDVLRKIVEKCNANVVDIDVSIHFNSCVNDVVGDGKTTGTEVLVHDKNAVSLPFATSTVNSISALGFKNRGVKINNNLYFLRNAKSPAMLIECCFVDDADDVKLYNAEAMANAIVNGIINT